MALLLYFVLGAAHLAALAAGVPVAEFVTKALLMPVLAFWLHRSGGPRLVVAGLALSAGGDVALEFDGFFIVGMGFFAAAHICYVVFFGRFFRAAGGLRWAVVGAYGVVWAVLVAVLWSGLGDLQLPVAGYSLLLTATAVVTAVQGLWTGLGGALFLLSDTLIAVGIADLDFAGRGLLVMVTYIAAQYLLASGSLRSGVRAAVSGRP
ncbi:lysoplasmalogenase [Actinocorallia sp. A-T 12471]|uniref:lysoplasmalogenase n=1 Tax=Actinocorallia sp. A-T 12471 TaxID=3089813 RepID=UPI0029D1332A|nr:lysoplasmalogenase [Actinocorallia sp. A-T 12471]MDX6741935.1 lysoplasmalogenase [Actinocorallia sp. A-T 12471]